MSTSPSLRILVVEDEWLIADQIAGALEDGGYNVAGPVGRAGEAIEILRTGGIDGALIDINVNGDRTFDLATRLSRAKIPFAFLTGYSGGDLPTEFSRRRLIQKPIDPEGVRTCVDGFFHQSKVSRSRPAQAT